MMPFYIFMFVMALLIPIVMIIMVIPSAVVMLMVLGRDAGTIEWTDAALELIQCGFLFLPILLTERELKRNFDENGRRI